MSLHAYYLKYQNRVQFLVIYIREAHPKDGWWLGGWVSKQFLEVMGGKAATDVYDPKTIEQRQKVALRCEVELEYDIPTYVDEIDDPVSKAYAAMPTRLYLVGVDGRVTYAGGLGPFGFKPAELAEAIEKYLGQVDAAPG